jgi:hypothetical protein
MGYAGGVKKSQKAPQPITKPDTKHTPPVRKAALKLDERARKVGHGEPPEGIVFAICSTRPVTTPRGGRTLEDKPFKYILQWKICLRHVGCSPSMSGDSRAERFPELDGE